ncbi:hypothetical protein TNCV_2485751 [Trichonephila clavipes]|uniref:Uncharacterized protein n=1 Tax=Trichonephila clavipes TaxID=2585209 RepID=A0A8X7BAZ5_TRICX|nr:hypothetical protein TNCV_2485751 [Trichonephila clavipes]
MEIWRNVGNGAKLASLLEGWQPYGFFWKLLDKSTNIATDDASEFFSKDPRGLFVWTGTLDLSTLVTMVKSFLAGVSRV